MGCFMQDTLAMLIGPLAAFLSVLFHSIACIAAIALKCTIA